MKKNILKHPQLKAWLPILAERLNNLDAYTPENIEKVIRESAQEFNTKVGILVNAIRTAVTGQSVGPGLIEALVVIGQRRVAKRLKKIFKRQSLRHNGQDTGCLMLVGVQRKSRF